MRGLRVTRNPCTASPWQIRHYNSAGSMQIRAAGFHSRKALIWKCSWPPEARKQQVQVLRQMYVDRGFTPMQLSVLQHWQRFIFWFDAQACSGAISCGASERLLEPVRACAFVKQYWCLRAELSRSSPFSSTLARTCLRCHKG